MELSPAAIAVMCIAAFAIGVAKSGIAGIVTFFTPFVAMTMPSRMATGIMLPLMIACDIVAVFYWRSKAKWETLKWVLPGSLSGLILGFMLLKNIDDDTFRPILGLFIVFITLLGMSLRFFKFKIKVETKSIPMLAGLFAGFFAMLANASAPIIAIYFLSIDLKKEDFAGTNAWFLMSTNMLKLPFSLALGTITISHLGFDALIFPLSLAGLALGIKFVKRVPQKSFNLIIQGLSILAGLQLLF
jgi:uncharacterized membrane protein YfcA